jgi:lysophospholipase L1-like esterase
VYAQGTPWLIGLFAAFLGLAMLRVFWPAPLMWFLVIMSAGAALLLIGLVAPIKRVREPIRRIEIFKLISVVIGISMMVAGTEAVLRLVPGVFDKATQQMLTSTPSNSGVGHPYIGHLHRPSRSFEAAGKDFDAVHSVDPYGFRNRWPWPERVEIVAVGDSLTFSLGVGDEHAWPGIVQRALNKPLINLGLVGAGPQQYLRLYETFGAKLNPRLLLVGVYAQNDFWDAGLFDQWLREGVGDNYMVWRNFGRPLRYSLSFRHPIQTAEGLFRAHVYPIVRSSHLYNLVRAMRGGEVQEMAPVKSLDLPDGGRMVLMPDDFLSKTSGAGPDAREFQLVRDALLQLHALATKQGARVLMVLQPSKEEVYMPLAGEALPDPTVALRGAFDAGGVEYLDLAPAFREHAERGERLFFEVDTHPNEQGYALIGELVTAYLKANPGRFGLED